MTRINCIPVEMLLDQHLFAEYREITRVSKLARPLDNYGGYTMGTGHVKFFYDKGLYLSKRCEQLYAELVRRGYNVTHKVYEQHSDGLNKDWQPLKIDKLHNLMRLIEKQLDKPVFYKLNGSFASPNYYRCLFDAVTKEKIN